MVQAPPQLAPQLSVRVALPQVALQLPYVYAGLTGEHVDREVGCRLVQAPPQLAPQLSVRVALPQFVVQAPYVYAELCGQHVVRVLVVLCRLVQEPPQLAAHDSVRVRTAFPQLGLQPPQPGYV